MCAYNNALKLAKSIVYNRSILARKYVEHGLWGKFYKIYVNTTNLLCTDNNKQSCLQNAENIFSCWIFIRCNEEAILNITY